MIFSKLNILTVLFFIFISANAASTNKDFITIKNGQFIKHGKPYYYVGTNFWYGAILGSKGQGGDRQRLKKELNFLKSKGIDNLRILVGADGESGIKSRVEPTLQTAPGVYNDTILDGLDYLMTELAKRDMYAILFLNNSWEWSGGYSVYLQWTGAGKAVVPAIDGWDKYFKYVKQFVRSDSAQKLFANDVKYILSRTNRYTGKKYVDDPAIMSWEIGNEPRAFSDDNKEPFAKWMASASALIKSIDSNHLLTSGSEGSWGCENDINLFEKIHRDKNIDYLVCHIWPYNWKWILADSLSEKLSQAKENTQKYINEHLAVAQRLDKPLVIEEFGFPRDGLKFSKNSSTRSRNDYYKFIFDLIVKDAKNKEKLAGCNFWGWGGLANSAHTYWERGDDYTGDPAQEEQGLNSVFTTDKETITLIKNTNTKLKKIK